VPPPAPLLPPPRRTILLAGRLLRIAQVAVGITRGGYAAGVRLAATQGGLTPREFAFFTCIAPFNSLLAPINAYLDFSLQVRGLVAGGLWLGVVVAGVAGVAGGWSWRMVLGSGASAPALPRAAPRPQGGTPAGPTGPRPRPRVLLPQVPLVLATSLFHTLVSLPMSACAFNAPGSTATGMSLAACRATTLLAQLPLADFIAPGALVAAQLCSPAASATTYMLMVMLVVGGPLGQGPAGAPAGRLGLPSCAAAAAAGLRAWPHVCPHAQDARTESACLPPASALLPRRWARLRRWRWRTASSAP
jgi:hypothetical protein